MQLEKRETHKRPNASAVLVVWSPAANDVWTQLRATLSRLVRSADEAQPAAGNRIEDILSQSNESAPRMRYCENEPLAIEEAVEQAASQGCKQVFVVPVALAMDASPGDAILRDLPARIAALDARHPDTEILYLGPPFDRVQRIGSLLTRAHEPETASLLQATIERGFTGDWALFAQFMKDLQAVLPPDTRVALRGSAVTGENYHTGQPFDATGPGTSDLDVALIGDQAMAEWKPEAFFFPNVNTMPLSDEMPDIAPGLNPARVALQKMVKRPVNIQAMQKWFLDLRSDLQSTPYVFLDA